MKQELEVFKLYCNLANLTRQERLKKTFLLLVKEQERHKLKIELEYDLTTF
jgi:rubrerythrin